MGRRSPALLRHQIKMTHGANQKIHLTKEKEMEVIVPGRRSLMMAMAIGSIPATGNARGKKKTDGNWKCWRWNWKTKCQV